MSSQVKIPCTIMRGGTSRGIYFLSSDLPARPDAWGRILTAVMGSGNPLQVNGVGGGSTLTSKAAIVSPSDSVDADVDYLFAQVGIEEESVDMGPSCGNILSGVAPFAIEAGLVNPEDGSTTVRVRNVNTDSFIHVQVNTPEQSVDYEGDTRIDGVPGSGSPVVLKFLNVCGTKTGKLFPTANLRDQFDGVEVSCVDASMPMVLIAAESMGKTGYETKAELDADTALLQRIERIRREAGFAMGLGDVTGKVIPKVGLVAAPANGGSISNRYFVPDNCHASHSVTGAICVSVASVVPGTVVHDFADYAVSDSGSGATSSEDSASSQDITIRLEHPSGSMDLVLETRSSDAEVLVDSVGLIRTARRVFDGYAYVSREVLEPAENTTDSKKAGS